TGATKSITDNVPWLDKYKQQLAEPKFFSGIIGEISSTHVAREVPIYILDKNDIEEKFIIPELYLINQPIGKMILGNNFINKYSPITIDRLYNIFTKEQKQIIIPRYFMLKQKHTIKTFSETFESQFMNSLAELFSDNPLKLFDRSPRFCKLELLPESKGKNIRTKPLVYSKQDTDEFKTQLTELKAIPLVQNSSNPHTSPAFMVRNYSEQKRGKARMVINYKRINKNIKFDGFHIPSCESIIKKLQNKQWFKEENREIKYLKTIMTKIPKTIIPTQSDKLTVSTDASQFYWAGVVSIETSKDIVGYTSGKFSKAEINYSTYEKEFLAVLKTIKSFKHWLLPSDFNIKTDNKGLYHYIKNRKEDQNSRRIRWFMQLEDFTYTISFVPGYQNIIADFLSQLIQIIEFSIRSSFPEPTVGRTHPALQIWEISPQSSYLLYYEKQPPATFDWYKEQKKNLCLIKNYNKFSASATSWCDGRILVIDKFKIIAHHSENNTPFEISLLGPSSQKIFEEIPQVNPQNDNYEEDDTFDMDINPEDI
ncbi:hypothetical protein Taro_022554, partial [Colocasia esculenta]|nr:hypothetical protein [Colocasia esculenta]